MSKTLSSITVNSPSGSVSAAVNDTFSFQGTPGFSGTGGVSRYDWKWEVDSGGGYVTIASSGTGLTTFDTNPVTNSNSQSANSITVTCTDAGSYTIRMAGAPATGGSYTVFSATRSVTVSQAARTGSMAAVESGADTFAGAGTIAIAGSATATESGSDTLAGIAELIVTGSIVVSESGSDTFAATGTVGNSSTGTMAAIESGADAFGGDGTIFIVGALAATESGNDGFYGVGSTSYNESSMMKPPGFGAMRLSLM